MRFDALKDILKDEPGYRMKQARTALFHDLVNDWNEVQALPLKIREKLAAEFPLAIDAEMQVSEKEDSAKALITLRDGAKIETVLMRHADGRNTVCVSTQVGCPMRCAFCATGKLGLTRNLLADEIVEQVLFFARFLKPQNERVSGVVFMGMGEPFLNYESLMAAIRMMHDPDVFNIGARRFSISTCGIIAGIRELAAEPLEVNLAISLHAPFDDLRRKLMPAAEMCSIGELLTEIDGYIKATNRKVMFEYLMIDKVNDTDECARELARLMKKKLYMVNLITYNPTGGFAPSPQERVKRFKEMLEERGVEVTMRHRFGRDIKGACGQLAGESGAKAC